MQSKLTRNKRSQKNRDFWAGIERAAAEFYELPQWKQDALRKKWDKHYEEQKNYVPTCHHCGQDTKGRCRTCYG